MILLTGRIHDESTRQPSHSIMPDYPRHAAANRQRSKARRS